MKLFGKDYELELKNVALIVLGVLLAAGLLLYKLSSLTGGVSSQEAVAAHAVVGWHGIYRNPMYLPLKFLRSVVFVLEPAHGIALTRVSNTILGFLAMINFSALIYFWHGKRTSIMASLLFGCSAWMLHVSRLASFDVVYAWGITFLLLQHALLYLYGEVFAVWLLNLFGWGLLLTIPGFIWLVLFDIFFQREFIIDNLKEFSSFTQRVISFICSVIFLPLVIINLTRSGSLLTWLGLPNHFPGLIHLGKNFVAVFVHLFIRGPQYPQLWLGKSPLLDAFCLAMSLLGIYFYATKWKSSRSHILAGFFVISGLLITLGGPVSFSLIVPIVYITAATGIAYLLHDWLKMFPKNPFARYLGIGLIGLAIIVSCSYNLRSYFIAWSNSSTTKQIFSRKL